MIELVIAYFLSLGLAMFLSVVLGKEIRKRRRNRAISSCRKKEEES